MSATLDPRRREAARLAELDRLEAMRPEADRVLQELVDDAREVFGTEFCLVNLVTSDRQYFRAWSGDLPSELAEVRRNPGGPSMCRYVVEDERPFVVEDFSTTEQARVRRLRMGPGVRFYAGTPLKTSGGHAIGSFCVLDGRPREFGDRDSAMLRAFAKAVVGRLEALGAAAHEREAKESERRYRRNVFELANDAILIYGAETGLILDANRRACEMYGIPQETLVGKKIFELSSEPKEEQENSQELLDRGSHLGFETVHRRADGTHIHVSSNSSVTEHGGQRAILSINRDVTERKRTEAALRLSEKRLAQAQRITRTGNWEHELGKNRTHWSDEMYRIFGLTPLSLVPSYKTFMLFVHPDDRERVRGSIRGALHGDRPKDVEYRIVQPDGEVRFVHSHYEVAWDESGRPTKFFGTAQDVTDRKRVEQKLREAEARYRTLVEQIPAVAYIDRADVADIPFYTSPRIEALLGYTPEEWLNGRLWLERLHPDDRDWVLEADTRARAAEEPFGEEYRLIGRDGRVVWVCDESVLLRDEAGRPLLWQGVLLDITERKRVEEALRRSEERFRSLIQNAPDVIMVLDADSTILYDSPSIQRVLGYEPGERIGSKGFDYVHPEDLGWAKRTFVEVLTNPLIEAPVEYRLRHKDGSWRDFEATRTNLLDDPAVGGVVINCRDVTEHKRFEEALRQSEARFRMIFERSAMGISIADPNRTLLETNRAYQDMLGYNREELLGKPIADISHPEDVPEDEELNGALLAGDRDSYRREKRYVRKDGGFIWARPTVSAVRDARGEPQFLIGMVEDITERKRAEQALRESEERYRLVARATNEVIWDNDLATGKQLWDGAVQTMFGYLPEELGEEGRWWEERIHPDDRCWVLPRLEALLGGDGELWTEEYRFRRQDGAYATVMDRAYVVRDVGGTPVRMLGSMMDITERKRTEEALRESERRHRRQSKELELLHRVRTALAHELEPPAVFRTVVETIARTYGYTQVSAYRLHDETLVLQHQVGYEQVLRRIPIESGIMGRVARTRQPILLGDVRSDPAFLGAIEGITSEVCVPLFDEGEMVGTLNVESTDGVELIKDDLALIAALAEHMNVALSRARLYTRVRKSEERFRSLIQNASDVITLLEADGTILYESPSVERMLGYLPDELIGKNAFEYVHPDDLDRALGAFSGMLTDPEIRPSVEYRFRRKDGSWCYLESVGSNLLDDPRVEDLVVNSRDITERKRWEEELRVAEERYRSLVETIPAITYVDELDEVSTSIYISPQTETMLGFTAEERMASPGLWVEQLHPEDRERVLAENERTNATGDPFDMEYRMVHRDGRELWVHDAHVVLRNAEGQPSYCQGVMFDVTERRRTEEALHASETRLRTVIEQSPLGIHIFAPDGTSLLANGAWDRLWCLDDEELGHANVFEDEQLREMGLIEHIERSVAESVALVAPPLLFDPANVGREGSERWLRALIYPVRGEDGRVLETVLLLEDVTERTRAQEALGESEERYRAVVEQSAEAIWLFDPDTKEILEANAAFQEMLGYGEELHSMTNYDFVAHSREDVDRTVMRKLRGGENPRGERKYRTKDGTLLDVEVGGTVISYRGKKVICSVARDITERKRVEEEIREANRHLSELATLRSDFTAMVAHEIGAPLATIRGFVEVLETNELGNSEQANVLTKIETEIEGLATLVADVRSAAVIEREDFSLAPRPVPIGDLVEDAYRFAETLRGDHRLVIEDAADGKKVCVDPYRIGQVMRNLLSNAAKHSPEGAPIKLRTSWEANSGRIRVEVVDRGRGVHPDDTERIFEKFGRGREADGRRSYGVGLGLYLSGRIVRAHGGELTYSPAPRGGSAFSFDLEVAR